MKTPTSPAASITPPICGISSAGERSGCAGAGSRIASWRETSGVAFAVRSMQIEFLAPALMDDLLRVETSIAKAGGASIEFRQQILCGDTELIAATVKVAAIRDGRPVRIPVSLRRLLQTPS